MVMIVNSFKDEIITVLIERSLCILQVYLSVIGLMSLYLGIGCAYSLTASMGFPFSPMHSFIPFLLVGLGKTNFILYSLLSLTGRGPKSATSAK